MDESINEGATAPLPESTQPAAAAAEGMAGVPAQPSAPAGACMPPAEPVGTYALQAEAAAYAAVPPAAPPAPPYYAAPAPAEPAPPASHHVPRWLWITAIAVAGVLFVGIVFGAGVAVGSHARGFERGPGRMMLRGPVGPNGEQGYQNGGQDYQNGGQGNGYNGYGGHPRIYQNTPDSQTTPQQ